MYSYSMFPLITKPTRVTKDTATLIDHIFTNNFDVDSKHVQGILCTSISDHYAVFHITGNASKSSLCDTEPSLRRNMCHANIVKFRDAMSAVNWREILSMSDAQVAYSSFHKLISDKYNKCFPIRKINKKYFNNKPWLTTALKESIKTKNKLYVDRYKGTNCNERCKIYKAYRNKLNHLLRSAERKHYQDLLNEHRSNVKKSWQIIKSVINKRKHNPLCTKFKCNDTIITLLKIFLCLTKDHQILCHMMLWKCFIWLLLLKQRLIRSYQISEIVLQAGMSSSHLLLRLLKPALKFLLHILAIFLLIQDYSLWN